jgi:uncharacterized protein YjiS (DUF1127 family)
MYRMLDVSVLRQPWSLSRAATAAADAVYGWQERSRQRHMLAGLDDRLLRDMGVSRADVARESAKPFWQV